MRYLIDNNTLSNALLNRSLGRNDVFVLQEIVDEYVYLPEEVSKIKSVGIKILQVEKKHLEASIEILSNHGSNYKLIRLYTNKGCGDVMMLAYAVAERDRPDSLFNEEYTLVTCDNELAKIAEIYGIKSVNRMP